MEVGDRYETRQDGLNREGNGIGIVTELASRTKSVVVVVVEEEEDNKYFEDYWRENEEGKLHVNFERATTPHPIPHLSPTTA